MKSKHLKFGLPFLGVGAVCGVALFIYAGAVQNKALAAVSMTDRFIPVDCSFARGTEGKDFMRDGQEAPLPNDGGELPKALSRDCPAS